MELEFNKVLLLCSSHAAVLRGAESAVGLPAVVAVMDKTEKIY